MNLFNEFMADRSELLQILLEFEQKHRTKILDKLKKEKDKDQFNSTIAELHFGLFFDSLSSSLKYDHPIDGKTPDWTVEMNGQQLILEVLRLGPSANDRRKFEFENHIFEVVHSIPVGCLLHLDYEDGDIDNAIDLTVCKDRIEAWLNSQRQTKDTLILQGAVEISFQHYQPDLEFACLSGGGGIIHFDYRRISSNLEKKAKSYEELVQNNFLPYIICIYMDFHSWFRKDDLFEILYGGSIHDITHNL